MKKLESFKKFQDALVDDTTKNQVMGGAAAGGGDTCNTDCTTMSGNPYDCGDVDCDADAESAAALSSLSAAS